MKNGESYISSVVQGIESFWLGVLSISAATLDRVTAMCRRFLSGGNSARVAWHTMCLSKQEGGLGLRDTQRWNDALLSKAIWNIHAKKDTLWCKWIHQFYIKNGSIWDIHVKDFPLLIQQLFKIRDALVEKEGSIVEATNRVDSWVVDDTLNTSLAYDYFKGAAAYQI
ncbi:hypothetical protein M9H77_30293 [Catharanthus roseus]|uniref:Uncharacterized protein n=1 Tax=Catharanthus roseus TaxID=4058 RepID=A0ACB9ZXR2_CATRO|nr:hypothetical protein M9H77_30293 [Catharanthus roseus]